MPDTQRGSAKAERRKNIIVSLTNRLDDANRKSSNMTVEELYYWVKEYRSIASTAMRLLENEDTT